MYYIVKDIILNQHFFVFFFFSRDTELDLLLFVKLQNYILNQDL